MYFKLKLLPFALSVNQPVKSVDNKLRGGKWTVGGDMLFPWAIDGKIKVVMFDIAL